MTNFLPAVKAKMIFFIQWAKRWESPDRSRLVFAAHRGERQNGLRFAHEACIGIRDDFLYQTGDDLARAQLKEVSEAILVHALDGIFPADARGELVEQFSLEIGSFNGWFAIDVGVNGNSGIDEIDSTENSCKSFAGARH